MSEFATWFHPREHWDTSLGAVATDDRDHNALGFQFHDLRSEFVRSHGIDRRYSKNSIIVVKTMFFVNFNNQRD